MNFRRLACFMLACSALTPARDDEEVLLPCAATLGFVCLINSLALAYSRVRNRHYLTRKVLSDQAHAAWKKLKHSKDDMAYLEVTGLTYQSFKDLHREFAPLLNQLWSTRKKNPRETRGRKRKMKAWDVLGLTLAFMHMLANGIPLRLIFAQPPSTLSRNLADGMCVLLVVIRRIPQGKILWPSEKQMHDWAELVERRQPKLQGCFAFVDGLNLKIEDPADPCEQNAYYNGWLGESIVRSA